MKLLIFCSNETQKVCILIFKTTWKSYLKNNEKIPGNLLKNLEKSWKYHGILSVRKSGNPVFISVIVYGLHIGDTEMEKMCAPILPKSLMENCKRQNATSEFRMQIFCVYEST